MIVGFRFSTPTLSNCVLVAGRVIIGRETNEHTTMCPARRVHTERTCGRTKQKHVKINIWKGKRETQPRLPTATAREMNKKTACETINVDVSEGFGYFFFLGFGAISCTRTGRKLGFTAVMRAPVGRERAAKWVPNR